MAILAALVTIGIIAVGAWLFASGQLPNIIGALFHAGQSSVKHSGIDASNLPVLCLVVVVAILCAVCVVAWHKRHYGNRTEETTYVNLKGWLD